MKKFYYSKETSQDGSPNVFPMEHGSTIGINNEQGRGMSTRAASTNSLDLMSETPTIPRATTRDVTRSMSDVATKSQLKKKSLVTETELSTSWLYKTMQASINARFKSPRKSPSVHKTGDLEEQSILQDPELKPIPIKSKAAKTSSCICHFATMIAISLCTVGFLASIAAIIYMEIFADRNITSLHTAEAEVNLSDVMLDSLEAYNLTTYKVEEEHILNEALTHRFDGDEEILNGALKASSTNDTPSLSSKNLSHEPFPDYVTDAGKSEISDFEQYINDTNSKIKFQDGVTIIYEMKSEETTEDIVSDFGLEFKGRSFGIDLEQTQESSQDNFGKSDIVVKENLKQELAIYTESDKTILNDSVFSDNAESTGRESSYDFMLNENQLKDLNETSSTDDFKSKSVSENTKLNELTKNETTELFPDASVTSEKFNKSDIIQSQDTDFGKGPNLDTNNVSHDNDKIDYNNKSEYSDNGVKMLKDSDVLTNFSDFESMQLGDVFRSTPTVDPAADEHDVNTMLVTIDDTEVSTDSFMSRQNGEIGLFQVSSPVPSVEPVKQVNEGTSVSPKKPVDIKGSLADAMKHLQKLDVNNKILTSRTKPKQKVNVQKPKRKATPNKDEERKHYLQRMRLMLFKQLQ